MSWWNRLWERTPAPLTDARLTTVSMPLRGWNEGAATGDMRVWRDDGNDVLSLSAGPFPFPPAQSRDVAALRRLAREGAESRRGGLIEVRCFPDSRGTAASWIYKRRHGHGYVFTGMLFLPLSDVTQTWCIVAGERGTTGLREAVVTARLLEAGTLTVKSYVRSWACDPYDAGYNGVDRSVLCFVSDDESYDEEFPWHPLTKVRRVQTELRHHLWPEP